MRVPIAVGVAVAFGGGTGVRVGDCAGSSAALCVRVAVWIGIGVSRGVDVCVAWRRLAQGGVGVGEGFGLGGRQGLSGDLELAVEVLLDGGSAGPACLVEALRVVVAELGVGVLRVGLEDLVGLAGCESWRGGWRWLAVVCRCLRWVVGGA